MSDFLVPKSWTIRSYENIFVKGLTAAESKKSKTVVIWLLDVWYVLRFFAIAWYEV